MYTRVSKKFQISLFSALCLSFLSVSGTVVALEEDSALYNAYSHHCKSVSDINEHVPVLYQYAKECSSVTEIGVRSVVSTWGILLGLSESSSSEKKYLGIDLHSPPEDKFQLAKKLSQENEVEFDFLTANDLDIELEPVDMLFIDSLHTYCHLTYELETFSPNVQKYICMHDTSAPWGNCDDSSYSGNYSEYPAHYDRSKRGLWPAVSDFLERHPEWRLLERRTNNHGFTILERIPE